MGFCTGKGWAILLRLAGIGKVGAVREEGQKNDVTLSYDERGLMELEKSLIACPSV